MCVLHDNDEYRAHYMHSVHGYWCKMYLAGAPQEKVYLVIEQDIDLDKQPHDIFRIPIEYCPLCGKPAYQAWKDSKYNYD